MAPDCECVATTAPPSFSTSSARSKGVHVLAGVTMWRTMVALPLSQVGQIELGSVTSPFGTSCL